ncbi:DnaA regulatory inactivator Hda [Neisseria sp. HMSC071C03]|uniref:DnaA regulatory inactivator Hda n=1 Tax=Morococcus cerebrosus TaxID=1056807 RepID=A0A0C1GUY9_9NEIS|nr:MULTISPECIES: DnaA regulatory inactivator Hda [Neisseriaceae]OFJ67883.1 DnaA regulatory inactivator Hda [Neisseria sp. HMSC073B07]OHR44809.1 DnaA regulatory inactivator Hda [Neisseria sp. HMSC071B12]OHR51357.1 DnaA regulatory inactivator Hda [Neisseria sp. HMSC071C03]KIC09181.1 DnaA regulatory inactivator Hda [Morococcus cerebrosus]UNV87715.1 DnaA regulatory inactivator Hda [Morococcus cerebrosus]
MNQLIFDFAERGYPGFDKFLGTENAELVYVLQHKHDPFIYVWGEEGAGKSHLLRAWVAQALDAGKKAVYIDAAATPLTEAAFEAEYLAIDQIEKLGNEEQALLFAVFNRFRNSGKGFLLLSSEHTPQQLVIREDLRTRMAYCLVYEVKPLTDREKIDVLVSMAAARQVTIDPEIFEYLLNHWQRDMDSLMQMLDTLDNYAVTMGKRITLPLLRQLLKQQETQ